MSVISAILTKDFIIVSSDSILNFESGGIRQIDADSYAKPKFVTYPKLKCIASYWGLAYIKVNEKKLWQTYEWLKSKVQKQDEFSSIEDFGNYLMSDLSQVLSKYNLANPLKYGIGIHIAGFERINDFEIPELFLLSNFKSINYDSVGELEFSRRTFLDLYSGSPPAMPLEEQRIFYLSILETGSFGFYNNGDPLMFNLFANNYHNTIKLIKQRGKLKGSLDKKFYKNLCSKPISEVSRFQREYYIEGSIIVGGKTHTVVMNKDGSIE